ncbi:MAG: alpha/beta hydrolase [Saprospiraceae bacterium]
MKGTLAYEVLEIIKYWRNIAGIASVPAKIEKIKFGAHASQYGLLCTPLENPSPNRLVYYLHGGGWIFGNPGMFLANGYPFLEKGYAVFLPTYRKVPRFNYSHMKEDVSQSLIVLKERLELEAKAEFAWMVGGMSAGANLAANLSLEKNLLTKIGRPLDDFKGTFLCGPPVDLNFMNKSPVLRFFAGKSNSALFKDANPVEKLKNGTNGPFFIIQGTKDGLVQWRNVVSFVKQFKETQDQELKYKEMKNGTHLDAVAWTYKESELRTELIDWVTSKMEA